MEIASGVIVMGAGTRKFLFIVGIPLLVVGGMIASARYLPGRWAIELILVVPLILIVILVIRHGFTLQEDYLSRWSKAHGLSITAENRPVIKRYLLRGRRIRAAGALTGYVGYSIYTMITKDELPFGWITTTFVGYLIGVAAAEVWALRPQPGPVRAASLVPRRITDYIPRWAIVAVRGAVAAIILVAASYRLLPLEGSVGPGWIHSGGPIRPDPWAIVGWTAAALVLAIFIEVTARKVVARPQPASSEDLVVVDDAIRSTSLHGLVGAGLALLLGTLTRLTSLWMPYLERGIVGDIFQIMNLASVPFALLVWYRLGIDQPWVVRRSRQPQVAT